MEKVRNGGFKLLVEILGATDKAHGGHAEAPLLHGLLRSLDKARGVGEAEIVVGAEIQRLASVLKSDLCALGGGYVPFILVESGILDRGQLFLKMFLEIAVHNVMLYRLLSSIESSTNLTNYTK